MVATPGLMRGLNSTATEAVYAADLPYGGLRVVLFRVAHLNDEQSVNSLHDAAFIVR